MAGVCLYAKLTFADSLSYLIGAPLLWQLEPILIKPLGWLALGWGVAALLAAFGLRPQSRRVRWALIIAGSGAASHPSADRWRYVLAALVQDTAHHVGNKLTLYARHRRAAAGDGGKAQG